MARIASVDANDALNHMRLNVTIKGMARLKVRLWIATRLIMLAGWVLGCDIHVEKDNTELTPDDFFGSGGPF